jgi:hypothetical protein
MAKENGLYFIASSPEYDGNYLPRGGGGWIYVREGSTWTEQASLFVPGIDRQGSGSVINANGTIAAMNGRNLPVGRDEISIWTRNGTNWTNTHNIPLDGSPNSIGGFGAMSMSGDGSYLLVGDRFATNVNYADGKVYVYKYNGSSWSKEDTLAPDTPSAGGFFGQSCIISRDATYAFIHEYGTPSQYAQVSVFTRDGTDWTKQDTITPNYPTESTVRDEFGRWGMGVNEDNSYLVVGAHSMGDSNPAYKNSGPGKAFIFKRVGSAWTQEQVLDTTTVPVSVPGRYFGWGTEINRSGTTVYVSSYKATRQGNLYIFKRDPAGSIWTQTDYFLMSAPPAPTGGADVGRWMKVQDNNERLILNDLTYNSRAGRLYIYTLQKRYLNVSTPIKSYGAILSFTGHHLCFPDGPLSQGQIVSANKNKYVSLNGPLTTGLQAIKSSESLPVVSLSNVVNDRTVFGVVDHIENDESVRSQESGIGIVTQHKELGDNRVVVNSLGEGAIWVVNTNGNLVSGDYITTSNVAGYGQKQDDSDTLYSYTVAKITMDCDFNPQDVPIRVIKKDENGQNILDSYGRLQWEDQVVMEQAYKIRYLTVDGEDTDEANSVWTAAYVGCTYHCG